MRVQSVMVVPQLPRLTLLGLRLPRVYMQPWGRTGDGEHQGCVKDLPAFPQCPGSELLMEGGLSLARKLLRLFISYKGLQGCHPRDLVLDLESGSGAKGDRKDLVSSWKWEPPLFSRGFCQTS